MTSSQHVYEIRTRSDKRGVDLISDALPFGRLWYAEPNAIGNAIGYAKFFSRSRDAVIRVYDEAGNVMETQEQAGDFKDSFSSGFLTVLQKTSPATQQPMGLENRFDCHSSLQQKLIAMSRTPTLVRKLLRLKIMSNSTLIRIWTPTLFPLTNPDS